MARDVGHFGWRPAVLRLSHDVLVEIATLLDLVSLLALRQVCRSFNAIARENVVFVRLLMRLDGPPIAPRPPPPVMGLSPEERVVGAYRLHKNWDLAALPATVRTSIPVQLPVAPPPSAIRTAPLPYHLPPGADAYPFLKLETFAPFRGPPSKPPSFGADRPEIPIKGPFDTKSASVRLQPGTCPSSSKPPLAGNFAAATLRAWGNAHSWGSQPNPATDDSTNSFGPSTCASPALGIRNSPSSTCTPPPAPAPRPTRVSSIATRAVLAKLAGNGRWGIFVVKREIPQGSSASADKGKGKQRADDGTRPLTAEALASLGRPADIKGKAKEMADMGEQRIKSWSAGEAKGQTPKPDEGAFLLLYDLDAVTRGAGGVKDSNTGKMAEYALRGTPSAMTCRATSRGVVVVLVRGVAPGTSLTTILRWDYLAPEFTNLGTHKTGCMLGAISISEFERSAEAGSNQSDVSDSVEAKRVHPQSESSMCTLVAIVHRPRTIMIQDIDSGQRCFVKLGKMPPVEHRHTVQAVHLLPGPRLLALRAIQGERLSYVLEEHGVPPMGETAYPVAPLQRQWLPLADLQTCSIVEGPTYDDGSLPDLALWAFELSPHRSVTHWLLRPTSVSEGGSLDVELGHDRSAESSPVEQDMYAPANSTYAFPAHKICSSRLSFPHHKVTLAPGARRAMWFERPERSRSGEARGMRGVWGYTSVKPKPLDENEDVPVQGVVRCCTSELPDDVLAAMENNTLGVAFDEGSGRTVAVTCGDGYSALTGSKIWILDYA
ncbi:Trimethylamine-N-oxide reductase [Ceratobasidium theobromae]|uniref:Trimethylamine-N-oxide reductase n=1 Tax=Ceratobasidium theobromae TaxID=1582974 RepID=A0A5N5QTM5_9AGAM|nr:Trimethylamine-N-oxide reductase [Ceratobasidium theobromae]